MSQLKVSQTCASGVGRRDVRSMASGVTAYRMPPQPSTRHVGRALRSMEAALIGCIGKACVCGPKIEGDWTRPGIMPGLSDSGGRSEKRD